MTVNLHWKTHLPHLQQISLFSSVQGYASLKSILALTCLLLAVTNVNQTLIIIFDDECNLFKPLWSSMHQLQCIRGGKWPINQLALKPVSHQKKKKQPSSNGQGIAKKEGHWEEALKEMGIRINLKHWARQETLFLFPQDILHTSIHKGYILKFVILTINHIMQTQGSGQWVVWSIES